MKNGFIGLRVRGVSIEKDEPIVVLEDRARDRRLPIPVSPFEASAIILELESLSPPRPLTHDLLAYFFEQGGFALDEVEIFGEPGSGSRARLLYHKGLRKLEKEVRPADALALALRLDAAISAEAAIFDRRENDAIAWHRSKILAMDEWKARA